MNDALGFFFSFLQAVPRIMVQSASIDATAAKIKQVSASRDAMVPFSSSHAWKPEGAKPAAGFAAESLLHFCCFTERQLNAV